MSTLKENSFGQSSLSSAQGKSSGKQSDAKPSGSTVANVVKSGVNPNPGGFNSANINNQNSNTPSANNASSNASNKFLPVNINSQFKGKSIEPQHKSNCNYFLENFFFKI